MELRNLPLRRAYQSTSIWVGEMERGTEKGEREALETEVAKAESIVFATSNEPESRGVPIRLQIVMLNTYTSEIPWNSSWGS